MKLNFFLTSALVLAIIGLTFQSQKTEAQASGAWQVVASSGGDGGVAWLVNTQNGALLYCYRINCFPPKMNATPN